MKQNTGRMYCNQKYSIDKCFAFECSFFKLGKEVDFDDYRSFGTTLMKCFMEYYFDQRSW